MEITTEGKLGLCLGLVALAGGGAMMVAPDKLWIGWTLIALAGVGAIGLGFHHFGRKFSFLFLVTGVLWFDYWYYIHILSAPEAGVATALSSPQSLPLGQLVSRMDNLIFSCDVPLPDQETAAKFPEQMANFKTNLEVWGDATGITYTFSPIRGGIRLVAEATTIEAKRRLYSAFVSKLTIEIRRIGPQETVNLSIDIPEILRFWSFMTPDPAENDMIEVRRKIETMLGIAAGKCKLV
jgi:hypothetical protein